MKFWPRSRISEAARWVGKDVTGLIPVRKVDSTSDPEHAGADVLLMPRFRSGWAAQWLQPRLKPEKAHVRVKLDTLGTFVWHCVDGHTTVGEIIARFEEAFPDQTETPSRVWTFLTAMERHGLLAFEGEAKPAA